MTTRTGTGPPAPAGTGTAAPPVRRAGRSRLARTVWLVAGGCWVVAAAATVTGADGLGHHDLVLAGSTLSWPARIAGFGLAWLVMIGAMMLPSTIPFLEAFWAVTRRRPGPGPARVTLLVAYFGVWLGFAAFALAGDAALHRLVAAWGWLGDRPGLVLGATLVLAGGFQFSALKKACLTGCRSPAGVLWQHYRPGLAGAWSLGLRHGLLCLGCCWALMLVMFATGTGSLAWMLLLTGVMVAEKTTSWGARLAAPTGVALLAGGAGIAAAALV